MRGHGDNTVSELSEVKEDIKSIRDKQHLSEMSLTVLEAIAQERHGLILDQIANLKADMKQNREEFNISLAKTREELEAQNKLIMDRMTQIDEKLNTLSSLAIQGKTSLKTLWFLGGLIAGVSGLVATWWEYLKL